MKFAIFGAALAATFALGGAARRDSFVSARANSGVRSWKDLRTEKVPSAAPSLDLRPFSALDNCCPGAKIRIVTDCLAISSKAVGRTNRLLSGSAVAERAA